MFDNKEFSFGRSGTAPTHQKTKATVYARSRPKTRTGISNDGGASDLADLNLALKMDNQLNIVDSDDAFENYQSAIDSWETGLKSRHAPQSASSSNPRRNSGNATSKPASSSSSRNNSAAYKSSDPVSAAYFSQFRPSSRSTPSSTVSSPRSRLKTANRTDEIKAVYGVISSSGRETQGGSASGHRRKQSRSSEAAVSARTSTSRNKSTDTSSNSRPPSAAASAGESQPLSGSARSGHRDREDEGSPPASHATSSIKAPLATATFQEPGSFSQQSPRSTAPHQKKMSNDTASSKGVPFKRQQLRVTTSPPADSTMILTDSGEGGNNNSSTTAEPSPPPSTKKGESSKSDRPESRKLYLGAGGSGTSVVLGGFQKSDSRTGAGGSSKVPRSAGAKISNSSVTSGSNGSSSTSSLFLSTSPPPDHCSSNVDLTLRTGDGDEQHHDPKLTRTSSFNGFSRAPASPAPWHGGDNINLDDRPPSRQRSAFPTHLGSEGRVLAPQSNSSKRRPSALSSNSGGGSLRNTEAFSSEAPVSKDLQAQGQTGSNITLSRPPSRQRLNAQHLWSGKPDGGEGADEEEVKTPDYSSDDDEKDEHYTLATSQSATSALTGGLLFDDMDFVSAPAPPSDKAAGSVHHMNNSSSPSPQLSLGPMYDPFADGFTQLESRGNTAPPFKIRYNPPSSQSSSNSNYKKPTSAAAKSSSTKRRMSNKAFDRDHDVDFNDCDLVEDYSELQHHHQYHLSSKAPSDQSSCRSSPSPEQFESYSAWRSNNSSPISCSTSSQQPQSLTTYIPRSKSTMSVAANKEIDKDKDCPLGKSASTASYSPTLNQKKRIGVEAARNRAFMNEGSNTGVGDMVLTSSGGGSPLSARHIHRNNNRNNLLASNLDDMSFADEELTEMSHCSDTEYDNGNNDINRFGGELSQSIMLESSLGQDFLNLFAPCD